MEERRRYHFVLVHGAHHGAWCWYKLIDRLQKAGHHVTALDMASAGQHPADANSIATFEQYNQPLTDFFLSLPENDPSKVVMIGHSMGGLSCLQMAETFVHRIGLLIYDAAVLLPSGVSAMDCGDLTELVYVDTPVSKAIQYNFGNGADKPPTSLHIASPSLGDIFYTDWDSQDVVLAAMLLRPVPAGMLATPITYTEARYGQVPKVYIKHLRDNAFRVPAQEWVIANAGPFNEVVQLDAGHCSFHAQVGDFAQLVLTLSHKYLPLGA